MKALINQALQNDGAGFQRAADFIVKGGMIATFLMVFHSVEPNVSFKADFFSKFFMALLAMLPSFIVYLGLLGLKEFSKTARLRVVAFITALTGVLFMNLVYFDSIYVHTDAQGALLFLFLPIWMVVGIPIIYGVLYCLSLLFRGQKHTKGLN